MGGMKGAVKPAVIATDRNGELFGATGSGLERLNLLDSEASGEKGTGEKGYARVPPSYARYREIIARTIDHLRKSGDIENAWLDKIERRLDRDHKKAVEEWHTFHSAAHQANR